MMPAITDEIREETEMSMQLRKGQCISLTELARQASMTPAQRVTAGLRRNDLTALAARFGGK